MLRALSSVLALLCVAAITSCGSRSALRSSDLPSPTGPLGLSLSVEELFQRCDVDANADGVRFTGTLRTAIAIPESGALSSGTAEVLADDGTLLARFELDPFSLHAADYAVTITKREGSLDPRGGCQLCSMPLRLRLEVHSVNLLTPAQSVESGRFAARCTR